MLMSKIRYIGRMLFITGILLLSIPVHEYGHYIVAKTDGAYIHNVNYFIKFVDGQFVGPSITVNETSFSSPEVLILCYLWGCLIAFIPGLFLSVILGFAGSNAWKYPFMWVVSAPLVSISDFDRILELFGLTGNAKWVHVGLGVYTMFMLEFMNKKAQLIPKNL